MSCEATRLSFGHGMHDMSRWSVDRVDPKLLKSCFGCVLQQHAAPPAPSAKNRSTAVIAWTAGVFDSPSGYLPFHIKARSTYSRQYVTAAVGSGSAGSLRCHCHGS